jgi:hypothetical protein
MQHQLDAILNLPSGPNGGPIMPKLRNRVAQDATLVNITALKKRVTTLERLLNDRTRRLDKMERGLTVLQNALLKVQAKR